MKISTVWPLLVVLALPALAIAKQDGQVLYRYTDENGVQVIDDLVPPRYVAGGYEIITPSGRVLKEVPPELTGAALAEKKRRLEREKTDRELLKRYSSVADIESARDRKLAIVQQDMAIMRSNIASLGSQIEREEDEAARIQRNGGEVRPERLQRIEDLRTEIEVLEERMALRRKEEKRINAEFDRAAGRYTEIAGK
ncbi:MULTISPECIES: hypothetical protein [Microbulbifer]|uniref:hypothetical protein n=1 Tax=Microbulbifer TaxID=48073 RepID=UPI001E3839F0|nr:MULTISPECIES: hypothetical protein [Microbulbifer]UHQ53906.1 hypothetical protein LVE68_10305 [Microbulbifer sp. YPW16]